MRAAGTFVLLIASSIWCVLPSAAQKGEHEPPCMECHQPKDTTIDPVQFSHSVHAALDCGSCHVEGFNKFPHTSTRAGMPDCIDCHSGAVISPTIDFDKISQGVQASVHVKMVDPAFRCTNCHSPHYFIPASRMTDASAARSAANKSCLGCHAAGDTPAANDLALEELVEKHRLFPHWKLHIQENACIACHTPRGEQTVHLILPKSEALRDCAACHGKNSLLTTKLYTHLALKERTERGWANAMLFNNAYLTGAIRNRWLDWATLGLAALLVLGIAAHGVGRWLFAILRRRS
ncbi:MAG TPA: cytochrome c3 family protein [Terriglobales bacterium]|nr:cytochrome c3 family protein [Dongiaceae bacterium]HVO64585.1 cytochrome c3 family protein [Terriglobales bacterium]